MSKVKINVYNKASERAVRKQLRNSRGQFSRRWPAIIFYCTIICAILLAAYFSQIKPEIKYQDKVVLMDTTQQIIDKEKSDILDVLMACESKGDENVIVWTDGGTGKNNPSFGAYQFKIGTIQSFVKGLTDFQSIALAADKNQSRELAGRIIFATDGGIYNWKNCMIKHGLLTRVNFVKELETKLNQNGKENQN